MLAKEKNILKESIWHSSPKCPDPLYYLSLNSQKGVHIINMFIQQTKKGN